MRGNVDSACVARQLNPILVSRSTHVYTIPCILLSRITYDMGSKKQPKPAYTGVNMGLTPTGGGYKMRIVKMVNCVIQV